MKEYSMKKLRNLMLVGASGAGKTTLAEQIFFQTKTTNRLGKIDEGNTILDFDPEETAKKMSLGLSIGFVNFKDHKINILDAPGYPDFVGDTVVALHAVENVVVVANAAGGFEVGLELALEQLEGKNKCRVILVNRMDNEHADYDKTLEAIHDNAGINPVRVHIPIGKEGSFEGVVDVIRQKAITAAGETDVPANMKDAMEEARLHLMEAVAETDEDLLNEFLENMELSQENLIKGIKKAIAMGEVSPAFVCSAGTGVGVMAFLQGVIDYLPSPEDCKTIELVEGDKSKEFVCSPDGELLGYIFKLYADPSMGDFAYVRIFSGSLKTGTEFYTPEKEAKDKAGNMYFLVGKNRHDCSEIRAGEIGALVKLKNAKVMNSIVALNARHAIKPVELPSATTWQTIKAVNQSDEDKIGTSLQRVIAEDPSIRYELNVETHENVLSGMGDQQLHLVLKKLKNRYKVDAELKVPRIPYKETITAGAESQYRHKKQSGGRGQYGEV